MRDDEVVDRLRRALRTEADMLTPGYGTPRVTPVSASRRRHLIGSTAWLGVAGLVVVAAAATIFLTLAHGPSTRNVTVGGALTPASAGRGRSGTTAYPAIKASPGTASPAPAVSSPTTGSTRPTSSSAAGSGRFVPLSATFVSPQEGWLLGVGSCGTEACLQLGVTTDRGQSWTTEPGPSVGGLSLRAVAGGDLPDVQVRFANPSDGWIFGNVDGAPILYATTDGGNSWSAESPTGQWQATTVEDLESSAGRVQLLYLTSSGVGVATAKVGTADPTWTTTMLASPGGTPTSAQLVMQHGVTWVVESDQSKVVGGAIWSGGSWQPWRGSDLPCTADGGPVVLAASDPDHVVAVCGLAGHQQVEVSADGGASWRARGRVGPGGAVQVATGAPGSVVAGMAGGAVMTSTDGGNTFASSLAPTGRSGRILQVGFEDATQGIVITAGSGRATLYTTDDGGGTWTPLSLPS